MKKEIEVRYCCVCGAEIRRRRNHDSTIPKDRNACSMKCVRKLMGDSHIPIENRFWNFVDPSVGDKVCWIWKGKKFILGYPIITTSINGRTKYLKAHRVSWEIANGRKIPGGLCILHSCDNPKCVNPHHLSVGTLADNVHDMINKGRARVVVGIDHPRAKLTEVEVLRIRELRAGGKSMYSLAKEYHVAQETIKSIVLRKTWKHI